MTTPAGNLASRTAPLERGIGWVVDGFRLFGADWLAWLLVGVLLTLLSMLLSVLPLLGPLALHLLMPVFLGGLMLGLARTGQGGRLQVADLFAAFAHPGCGRLLRLGLAWFLLHLAIMAAGVAVAVYLADLDKLVLLARSEDMMAAAEDLTLVLALLSGLLVYVALALPVAMLVWFAPALVVLEGEGALAAMRHSFVGCLRNFGPFLLYGLVGLLLFPLLLVVTLGLGFLVLVPVGIVSIYLAYQDIFHRQ